MIKRICWGPNIRARWCSAGFVVTLLLVLGLVPASTVLVASGKTKRAAATKSKRAKKKSTAAAAKKAPPPAPIPTTLEGIVRRYKDSANSANRTLLVNFAQAHSKDEQGALALLALATIDLDELRPADALPNFVAAIPRLPLLADFTNYGAGRALAQNLYRAEAIPYIEAALKHQPSSPYRGWALVLLAQCKIEAGAPAEAVEILKPNIDHLPQPHGWAALGRALHLSGDVQAARPMLERVYRDWPRTAEADQSGLLLAGSISPELLLARAEKLMQAGGAALAAAELRSAMATLPVELRDLARVRIGAAKYFAREYAGAWEYLRTLAVTDPKADAERLYYRLSAARRLDRWEDVDASLRDLSVKYPQSQWRLEALVSAANRHLMNNETESYLPLYKACYSAFPNDPQAPFCHWRTTWVAYSRREPDAGLMLQEHLNRYPQSPDAPAALYYLGRMKEPDEPGAARVYYEALTQHFPNYYYGVIARDRLAQPVIRQAHLSDAVRAQVSGWKLPSASLSSADFTPDSTTQRRIERARLLAKAGLNEVAELELRYGAKTDSRAPVMAIEASQIAAARGAPGQGLRNVKSMASSYLSWDFDRVPAAFWKAAFPLHYRESLERFSQTQSLDPYLVAGLIRQESEFDPRALSRAKAMGLTQIMPGTGRELSRRLGIGGFTTAQLYQPEVNLRLGTYYMRQIVDSFNGSWEAALAAYNAGPSRAKAWLAWGNFKEPSEFIEWIPFSETRNYVQTVMRNAEIYRRIYGSAARAESAAPRKQALSEVNSEGRP